MTDHSDSHGTPPPGDGQHTAPADERIAEPIPDRDEGEETEEKPLRRLEDGELQRILADHKRWIDTKGRMGRCADLSDAILRGANLQGAWLNEANLRGAHLSKANLSKGKLFQANLRRAFLAEADFSKANLGDADLYRANLYKADLRGADLGEANLVGANLDGAVLRRANLRGAYLIDADLSKASLVAADLYGANLAGANLSGADFQRPTPPTKETTSEESEQAGVENEAKILRTCVQSADFSRAELPGAEWSEFDLEGTNLREANLTNADLNGVESLLAEQLAGADVTNAKLPEDIKRFEALGVIKDASSNARKLFLSMLLGCAYAWLTVATTSDAQLVPNASSSPLPIIQAKIPIVGFYAAAPLILLGFFVYFHLCMQKIWERMATLPAFLPDGRKLNEAIDPWLMAGLVQAQFPKLVPTRTAMDRLQHATTVFLAWFVVPLTLLILWGRYLRRHDWLWSTEQVIVLIVAGAFAIYSYQAGMCMLRGEPLRFSVAAKRSGLFTATGALALFVALIGGTPLLCYAALQGWVSALNADLAGADVSTKPTNWAGDNPEQLKLVKPATLRKANLRGAMSEEAFLVKADLSGAHLENANLSYADLEDADLGFAHLEGANLSHAHLKGANLFYAHLKGARYTWTTSWPDGFDPKAAGCVLIVPDFAPSQPPSEPETPGPRAPAP